MVESAGRAAAAGEADLALNLLWGAEMRAWRLDPGDGIHAEIATLTSSIDRPLDARTLAIQAAARGRVGDGLGDLHDRLPSALDDADPAVRRFLGMAAATAGDFVVARPFFASAADILRLQGRLGLLAHALVQGAWVTRETTSLRSAAVLAAEGARLADETRQPLFVAGANVTLAAVAAGRGDATTVDRLATEIEAATAPTEAGDILADLALVRGVFALALGRPAEALRLLQVVFEPSDAAFHEATGGWAIADLVEAAVLAGHPALGAELFEHVERAAGRPTSPRLRLAIARARPWLAADDQVERLYEAALADDLGAWPFVHGRLLFNFGVWLRRHRRVADARKRLHRAAERFDAYGAAIWADRANGELRATGETGIRRAHNVLDELTPQELQICRLAARGLSNREIGAQLFLSHRTVGFHLYRAFPKLDITSRAELARALPEE
jgi:DNA-binding CsgD family transcriptional regulator